MILGTHPIAAIDVGSNAIRLLVGEVSKQGELIYIEKIREPVRLGGDVFSEGKISSAIESKALKAFKKFRKKMDQYAVDEVKAVATSAVREAENGLEFVEEIKSKVGIEIEVIDAIQEAELVQKAVDTKINCLNKNVLIMDIGGGSVEFIYSESDKIKAVDSFPFGTVRSLKKSIKNSKSIKETLEELNPLLKNFFNTLPSPPDVFVGTGGNMVCMGYLRTQMFKKTNSQKIKRKELKTLIQELEKLSIQERQMKFRLKPDRADVILPASYAVFQVMEALDMNEMLIPQVGLREGVLIATSEKYRSS
ncbi:MAG: hypothetical protein KDD58_07130 [Bdellovibrionales bacterium]|nr:hypothetical protein [Bdellovibrionales bacterium]